MNKIKVITKRPNEKPEIKEIDSSDYEFLYDFCEGMMDATPLPTDENVTIFVNDNSLNLKMPANIVMPEWNGVLAGPMVLATHDEEGNMISLSDAQIEKTMKYLERNSVYNMSIERAYLYSKVIGPLQRCEDELEMEM